MLGYARTNFRYHLAGSSNETVKANPRSRRIVAAAGLAITVSLFAVSGAQAQNCGPGLPGSGFATGLNFIGLSSAAAAAAVTATSDIIAANTAFLTQSTAFVSAPGNPQPGQEGGGVWVRGVGGELTFKSNQSLNGTLSATLGSASLSGSCSTKFDAIYGGVQVGSDVAKLNIDGWNFHLGTTAGAIWSSGSIVGGSPTGGLPSFLGFGAPVPVTQTSFDSTSQSPFVGTYVVATKGNFFADALFRYDNYDLELNSPGSNLFGQKLDAHGISLSGSMGYNYKVPNSDWFVEPSAGLIWSRTKVDPMNVNNAGSGPGVQGFSGTLQISDIHSLIGRLGLRFGTTVESGNVVYQPFAAVSVWHEFDDQITANYQSCNGCLFFVGVPINAAGSLTTTNVGTFGQYSVGVSGQIVNTGWLGFVRLDYRNGDKLESWSGTAGIRYQFTPEVVANSGLPVKAPVYKAPPVAPVSWTGWYVGAIVGGDFGRSEFNVPGLAAASLHPSGVLAGGTIGYNYQIDRYVIGIEADGSWTNYTGSADCAPLVTGFVPQPFFQTTCHDDMRWIASVAGRVGYLFGPRILTYLKGGVAFGHETWSVSCNLGPLNGQIGAISNPPNVQTCINPAGALLNNISAGDTRVGGTIGYGVEFALTRNWSAKAETDWTDFGSKNLTASDGTVFTAKQWSVTEVKVGVNYHF
jgi:outer membrane autotransporter protein